MGTHLINHSFQRRMLVPFVATTNNIFFDKGDKVVTKDGVESKIYKVEPVHICSQYAETLIGEIYKIDPWTFLKKWNTNLEVSSTTFLYFELRQDDTEYSNEDL